MLHKKFTDDQDFYVHDSCRKTYTAASNIEKARRGDDCAASAMIITRTSSVDCYDYPTHCLICAKRVDFEETKRHPDRCSPVCRVEVVM